MSAPSGTVAVHHMALEVRRADVAACERFWALLGFTPVEPPAALKERSAWLRRGGQQIHLLVVDEPCVPPAGHVAVVADDYATTLANLRAAGAEPDPRAQHWGSPRCFVRCPAGHRVEVMAFAPQGPTA